METPFSETAISGTDLQIAILFLVPVASVTGIFTLLAVVGWAKERRREREALYRHETARKLVEHGQMNFEQFKDFERAEAARPLAARRRALSLAGSVLAIAGLTGWVALSNIPPAEYPGMRELAVLGFVPLGIGGALLAHAAVTSRREGG